MSKSKTKKTIEALQDRVNTIELNGDMIEKAIGRGAFEQTLKCSNEIKTLIEAYAKQIELNKKMNIKIKTQRNELIKLKNKRKLEKKKVWIDYYKTQQGNTGVGRAKVMGTGINKLEQLEKTEKEKCGFLELIIINYKEFNDEKDI